MMEKESKWKSRKLVASGIVFFLGSGIALVKWMSPELFREWAFMAMGCLAIYTGGNVGQYLAQRKGSEK